MFLALCCFAPVGVGAEPDLGGDARLGAGLEPSYRSWDIEDRNGGAVTIRQVYVPFSATVSAGDRFDFIALGAWARTTLDFGDEDAVLSGITDARLKGVWRPSAQAFLSLGVNLPIGKQTLFQGEGATPSGPGRLRPLNDGAHHREIEVAQAMWSPLLGFRARRMGEGFDVEISAGAATRLSSTLSVGAGGGYTVKGGYDLYETPEGTIDFRPGAEASASAGFDWRPAEGALFRLDVAGRTFQDDQSGEENVYRAGTQLEIEALIAKVTPKTSVRVRARNIVKNDDKRFEAAGDEILTTAVRSSNSLWAMGEVYISAVSALAVGLEARTGIFGDSDAALSAGSTAAIGPGVRWSGAHHRLGVRAQWLYGNAEDNTLDLSGVDLSAAFTVMFR